MSRPTRTAAHRRRRTEGRGHAALTGTALLVTLWLGLTAPSVSPAAGPAVRTVAHTVAVSPPDFSPHPPQRP